MIVFGLLPVSFYPKRVCAACRLAEGGERH
jgi:hypothetical protein